MFSQSHYFKTYTSLTSCYTVFMKPDLFSGLQQCDVMLILKKTREDFCWFACVGEGAKDSDEDVKII